MTHPRRLTIEKRSYSARPWRLVDSLTGAQIGTPVEFDHPVSGRMVIMEYGFDTKAAAIEHLGVMAAALLDDTNA